MNRNLKRIVWTAVTGAWVFLLAVTCFAAGGTWKQNRTGWWYAYEEGGYAAGTWEKIGSKWYHFDEAGYMQTGWIKDAGKWYYLGSTGTMQTGWQQLDGSWYYLADSGAMQTGWVKSGGKWYYLDRSGAMQTGWLKSGGKWYYLADSGAMQTGWVKLDGKWYDLAGSGAMQTGWVKSGGKWYYLDRSGVMQTGWLKSGGKWYYLADSGAMQVGWQNIDGKAYYFNKSGAYILDQSALMTDDLRAYLEGICQSVVTESMTSDQKLRALFEYVADRDRYPYKSVRIPYYHEPDWPAVYATDRMNGQKADCHSYAALFGYLAKMCGYPDVYWCCKSDHAWVEIGGLVYDPVFLNSSAHACDVFGLTYAQAIENNPHAWYFELVKEEGTFQYIRIPEF